MQQSLFDFVAQHQNILETLYSDDGEISIPPDQFDFGHKDLVHDEDTMGILRFYVEIGTFKLFTEISPDDMSANAKYIRNITNVDVRESVVKAMEEVMLLDAIESRKTVEDELNDARQRLMNCESTVDSLNDAMRLIKNDWGVV